MVLRFVFGRGGSGKSTYLLNEIKQRVQDDETTPVILLVPEQYSFEMEKKISSLYLGKEKDKYMRTRVLTFNTMSALVFTKTGGLTDVNINSSGKAMITYKAIEKVASELNVFSKAAAQTGFVGSVSEIISELKQYNVKATFFVIGKTDDLSKEMYKKIVEEGHTLGMHSYSHKYSVIYDSMSAFEQDFNQIHDYLKEVTGVDCKYYRFPGGSSNQVSNSDMREFIRYLNDRGITYYDWNVSSGDATSQAYTADELIQNVMGDVTKYKTSVVLMHDSAVKPATVEALPALIEQLQGIGAEILPIDENTATVHHVSIDGEQGQ